MTTPTSRQYGGLLRAGAGSGLGLVQLSALFLGLLAPPALCALVLLPLLAVGLVAAIVAAPPYVMWRAATRRRRRAARAREVTRR
jgi:hypothetical protein